MGKPDNTGFPRVVRAFNYSMLGLRHAWRNEAAFRQELALCAVMLPAALWLGRSAAERALLVASCLLVLVVELLNSAVEAAVDRFGVEIHALSARAKDQGSAAVFMALVLAGAVWAIVAFDRFAGG